MSINSKIVDVYTNVKELQKNYIRNIASNEPVRDVFIKELITHKPTFNNTNSKLFGTKPAIFWIYDLTSIDRRTLFNMHYNVRGSTLYRIGVNLDDGTMIAGFATWIMHNVMQFVTSYKRVKTYKSVVMQFSERLLGFYWSGLESTCGGTYLDIVNTRARELNAVINLYKSNNVEQFHIEGNIRTNAKEIQ